MIRQKRDIDRNIVMVVDLKRYQKYEIQQTIDRHGQKDNSRLEIKWNGFEITGKKIGIRH